MADRIGIIVNGATGRMAKNQHLINRCCRSGVRAASRSPTVSDQSRLMVVGRKA